MSSTTDVANLIRRLADRFLAIPAGGIVTKSELSQAAGQDVFTRRRYLVYDARDLAAKEACVQFRTLPRVGYQRLHSNELVKIGQSARKQIRRKARNANKGMTSGMRIANDLTAPELNALLREQSALGIIEEFARDKNLPKVPEEDKRPLTAGQSARQFLQSIGAI